MHKVAIVQRRIPQFRNPFFERLSRQNNTEITVFHSDNYVESNLNFKTRQYNILPIQLGPLQVNFSNGLLRQLLKGQYDVIVFEGAVYNLSFLFYIPLLKLLGRKICWWSIGFEPYYVSKLHRLFRNLLYRFGSRLSDRIIAYHEKSKNYYQELGNKPSKIHIAWNVFDDKTLLDAEAKVNKEDLNIIANRLGLKNKHVILYVGKIENAKRLGILIQSFEHLLSRGKTEDMVLLIIGGGIDRAKWESYVKAKNINNIIFIGEINDLDELVKYFKLSKIFVMPGTGGMAIYQAMVYGLPVVVSDPDGVDTNLIIDNETGFYFRFDDPDDLARKLDILLQKGDVYLKKIGTQAKQKALNEFPMSRMVDNFYNAIMH